MNLELPDAAERFGQEASRALGARGGIAIARQAFVDPQVPALGVGPLLEELGIGELRQAGDVESLMAAVELCRAAGAVALPYPVAARLAGEDVPVAVVDRAHPQADHATVFDRWLVIDQDGASASAQPGGRSLGSRLGFFVAELVPDAWTTTGTAESAKSAALFLTFQSAVALGVCQEAFRLTVDHARQRRQFGKPLARFQSVRFRLAEASTELAGLEELTRYTAVQVAQREGAAVVDVLGLRLQMITVSRRLMRTAHQLHGAMGFCDEYDLSVFSRYLQPLTRLPADRPGTVAGLLAAVDRYGFDATHPVPPFGPTAGPAPGRFTVAARAR